MRNTDIKLPEMTVEADREPTTAHGITEPITDVDYTWKQVQEAMILNEDAKTEGWDQSTLDILRDYIPIDVTDEEIKQSVLDVCGHSNWREVSLFVQDDACSEFFNMALKYCLREGQSHEKEKGFIDGSGIGYLAAYRRRLKVTLEECFDAKYLFKRPRPLAFIHEQTGMDLTLMANKVHPGHWAYPAGHGTKFLTAVEVLNDVFNLDKGCYKFLLIAACVESLGRSGNLIHYPDDNLAGGKLTTLKEFK